LRFSWKFLNQWKLNENYYAVYVKSHLVFFDSSTIFYQLSFHATLHHNLECQYLIQNCFQNSQEQNNELGCLSLVNMKVHFIIIKLPKFSFAK